jgi:predicted DNA-binding transcriptional regulator AlpA
MATALEPTPTPPPGRKNTHRGRVPMGLLRRAAAARYCGAGVSTWDRWSAAGLTPAPVRIGGAVLWSRHELAAWCRHGCPPRSEWQPLWAALRTARRSGRAK